MQKNRVVAYALLRNQLIFEVWWSLNFSNYVFGKYLRRRQKLLEILKIETPVWASFDRYLFVNWIWTGSLNRLELKDQESFLKFFSDANFFEKFGEGLSPKMVKLMEMKKNRQQKGKHNSLLFGSDTHNTRAPNDTWFQQELLRFTKLSEETNSVDLLKINLLINSV